MTAFPFGITDKKHMSLDVSFLEKLDSQIKRGEGSEVRSQLQAIRPAHVPRQIRAGLAKIALRVGEASFAMSLLRPLVHSSKPLHPPLSEDERIQYGMSLKQLGASDHALRVFQSVHADENPEVLLYEAITFFTQWKYREAIPKLKRYIESDSVNDYQKSIGKLNLAAALIFQGRYQEACELLAPLLRLAQAEKLQLLQGNVLELLAQVKIHQKSFAEAMGHLQEGKSLIQHSAPIYQLFLEKWTAISELLESKASLRALQNLKRVREKAIGLKHWETVRDCDFYFATGKPDAHLFKRVYFGTPFEAYRERLLHHFPEPPEIPSHFLWRGNTAHYSVAGEMATLDLNEKSKDLNLRTIKALAKDFYSPVKPFALYLSLFPQESLDPEEALPRIFSAVSRAKKWLHAKAIPIEIENSESGYRLHWTGAFGLKIPVSTQLQKASDTGIQDLQRHFGPRAFSSSDAAEALALPQRSVVRLLNQAVSDQSLKVDGKGRKTRYRFKPAA